MTKEIEEIIESDEYKQFMDGLNLEFTTLNERVCGLLDETVARVPAKFMNVTEIKKELHDLLLIKMIVEVPEQFVKKTLVTGVMEEKETKKDKVIKDKMLIKDMEFSARTENCLIRNNIKTLDKLLKTTAGTLKDMQNFGRKSLAEVVSVLSDMGLELKK